MKVLVVEDDAPTVAMLRRGLEQAGHDVVVAPNGAADALVAADTHRPDAVVLDLMLGDGEDGIEICRRLRSAAFWGAIVMLTARHAVGDRVAGLDAGADDYLVKPFPLVELLARLRAQERRPRLPRPVVLRVGDLGLDPATRRCWRGEVDIRLTRKEFGLLAEFLRRPGDVLSREHLLVHVWDDPAELSSNIVDQTVGYLRRKIDTPFGRTDLETVRGAGYRLRRAPS